MVRFLDGTKAFVLPDDTARDVLEQVHADAPEINVPPRVGPLKELLHVMHICSYMYKNEFDHKDVESLSEKRANHYHHALEDDTLRFYISRPLFKCMIDEDVMKFVAGICNDNVRFIYRRLPVLIYRVEDEDRLNPDQRSYDSDMNMTDLVVSLLRYFGDDGCYRWISDLIYGDDDLDRLKLNLPITRDLLEYFVESPQFCTYFTMQFMMTMVEFDPDWRRGKHRLSYDRFDIDTLTYIDDPPEPPEKKARAS